jgi:hypothetical protein
MYKLSKVNSIVGWVSLDTVDIMTIKSALYAFKLSVDGTENDDVNVLNYASLLLNGFNH